MHLYCVPNLYVISGNMYQEKRYTYVLISYIICMYSSEESSRRIQCW